jgi:hypothetical protein
MKQESATQVLQQVVEGMKPLATLDLLGLGISFSECKESTSVRREWAFGSCHVSEMEFSRRTIALGLLRVIERGWDVEAWAAFVLAAPFIVVLDAQDDDELIHLLWTVSAGESLTASDFALLERYASDIGSGS